MRTHRFQFRATSPYVVAMVREDVRVRTNWGADTRVETSIDPNSGTLKIVAKRRRDLEQAIRVIKGDAFYAQHFKD